MAQNQYRQRWQQEGPTRPEYYSSNPGQRGWNDGGHGAPQYRPDTRGQQGWQKGSHGHGSMAAPQPYQREAQWEDPYYQEQYQAQPYGSGPPVQQGQVQSSGRSYQYDDRFHNGGHSRPQQAHGGPNEYQSRLQEKHRPPPMSIEKKQKPKERILVQQPESPKEIAWDNPFPTFNTKKKEHKKNHSSLDKGMNRLDLNPNRSAEQRPNTSQSHRRQDESRPHTSHGQRPPDPPGFDFDGPRLPLQPPMSPLRKDPPGHREFGHPDGRYDAPMQPPARPGPNPLHPEISTIPQNGFQNAPHPQQPYPPRSNTMPDARPDGSFQGAMAGSSAWQVHSKPPMNSSSYDNAHSAHYNGTYPDQPSDYPTVQRSRSHEAQITTGSAYNGSVAQDNYGRPAEQPMRQNRQMYGQYIPPLGPGQSDVPNFDAIPPTSREKEEIHLDSNPYPPQGQPAYQKNTYQAPGPFRPQLDTRKPRNPEMGATVSSPLADFAFDIPGNGMNGNHVGGPPGRQIQPQYNDQYVNDGFPAQQGGSQRPDQSQRIASDTAGFPPRGASRADPQPRSASDARQYPLPNPRGYQQQSPDHTQSMRPNTSHGSGNRNQAFEQPQRPPPSAQNDFAQSDPQLSMGSRPPYGQQGLPQGPRRGVAQSPQNSYGPDQEPRPKISGSARPPPVRHYGDGPTSLDVQPSYNSPTSYSPPVNPDALPAHPVPIRPGLANNPSVPQALPRSNGMPQPQVNNMQRRDPSGQAPPPAQPISNEPQTPPVTVSELNTLQQAVKNNPSDYPLALKFAKKLVEAASVLSNDGGKADAKTTAKNRERYIFDAHKIVKKLVNAGYPDAMFYLADCHGQGLLGLAPDPKEAFLLYQSAAKLNHAPSAYRVAVCCEMGLEEGGGTRRDPLKAIQWYKRAATLGDTPAMYKIGMILLKGLLGQPKNSREALSWLKRAAERADADNPHALHELGLLYESAQPNDHVIRDEQYAFQLFKQAADFGYKYSQFRLGSAFEYGILGCPTDARQSIAWYTRAASQGEHQSELALSGWYLTGSEGILQQSDTEAYLWARKAASSGLAKAEYAMGYFTEVGIGVPANLEEAKRWYYRAASQGFPKARERLEELKRGGQKQQRTRVSRSAVNKQNEGDCVVM